MITCEIFGAHLLCKYKSFLKKSASAPAEHTQYEQLISELQNQYRHQVLRALAQESDPTRMLTHAETKALMENGHGIIRNASVYNAVADLRIDSLERVRGKSKFGSFYYQPYLITRNPVVSTHQKLILGFIGTVLADAQGRTPLFGKIIYGASRNTLKVRLTKYVSRAKRILGELTPEQPEPRLILNSHCKQCEFRGFCRKKALDRDDLSLLSKISSNEIASLNKRGIFTVTQLSHKFRPRRRHKGLEQKKKPHMFSLQALAIRTGKVHVYNCAPIPRADVEMFLDVECDVEREFFYLIGLRIRRNGVSE